MTNEQLAREFAAKNEVLTADGYLNLNAVNVKFGGTFGLMAAFAQSIQAEACQEIEQAWELLTNNGVGFDPDAPKSLAGRVQLLINWKNSAEYGFSYNSNRADENLNRAETAEQQLAEARAQEWISVKERMSECGRAVIVWCPSNQCHFECSLTGRSRDVTEWEVFGAWQILRHEVTHWRELPEPPNAESQEPAQTPSTSGVAAELLGRREK